MKKALLLLCFLICLACASPMPYFAYAQSKSAPHVKITGDVWLLSTDGNKLFLLPDTYYAKIDNLDETYYYISFNGVAGKVQTSSVSTVGYHEKALGTMQDLKIADSYAEFDAINLKSRPDLSASNVVCMPIKEPFIFLGRYPAEGELWYYVKYNQYYGYIKADRTSVPDIAFDAFVPLQPNEEEPPAALPPKKSVLDKLGSENDTLKIIIIVGLAIPAILIIFLIFKPTKYHSGRF